MFKCESDEGFLFGSFDGERGWRLPPPAVLDPVAQELVSAHEERHRRLQVGTVYGAAMVIATGIVRAKSGPKEPWRAAAQRCRRTHEVYATFLSAFHLPGGLDALVGNLLYLDFWRTGHRLWLPLEHHDAAPTVLEPVFHSLMSPPPAAVGDGEVVWSALSASPDERMAALLGKVEVDAGFAAALAFADDPSQTSEARLDAVAEMLTSAGIPTLDVRAQDELAAALAEERGRTAARTRVRVAAVTADPLDAQLDHLTHETIVLRENRLPLAIGAQEMPPEVHPMDLMVSDAPRLGMHAWVVLFAGECFYRQFATVIDDEAGIYFGLLSHDTQRAWFLPLGGEPMELPATLSPRGVATIYLTTYRTLGHLHRKVAFDPATPVFVWIDEPVRSVLAQLETGARPVVWTSFFLRTDTRLLDVVVTHVDGPEPLYQLWIGSHHAFRAVSEWLRRRAALFRFTQLDELDVAPAIVAVVQRMVDAFHEFGNAAVWPPSDDGG